MEIVIANQEEIRFDGNKNQVVLVFIVARVIANTNVVAHASYTHKVRGSNLPYLNAAYNLAL